MPTVQLNGGKDNVSSLVALLVDLVGSFSVYFIHGITVLEVSKNLPSILLSTFAFLIFFFLSSNIGSVTACSPTSTAIFSVQVDTQE